MAGPPPPDGPPSPDAVALTDGRQTLTRSALARLANSLRRQLPAMVGDRFVGVVGDGCVGSAALAVAVVECGAAYVPLSPRHPAQYSAALLESLPVQVLCIFSPHHHAEYAGDVAALLPWRPAVLPADPSLRLAVRDPPADLARPMAGPRRTAAGRAWPPPDAPRWAYCAFTSNTSAAAQSPGHLPKYVLVPQATMAQHTAALARAFDLDHRDRILLASPLCFDPSVVDLFGSLSAGATVLCLPLEAKRHPAALFGCLLRARVSVLQCTPSLCRLVASYQHDWLRQLICHGSLRLLALGGEPFPACDEVRAWLSPTDGLLSKRLQVYNLYGVTELSVWQTLHCVDLAQWIEKGGRVPIGMPLPGTVVKVLDEAGAEVGENGEGEVAVGGMARATYMAGDLRVYDPARLRATGDLATVEAGAVYLKGRRCLTVKVLGQAVHLEEVEEALAQVPGVGGCCVVALPMAEGHLLAAGWTAAGGPVRDTHRAIRRWLCAQLPLYKRPLLLHRLPGPMPVTPNGKVDRCAVTAELAAVSGCSPDDALRRPAAAPGFPWVRGVVMAALEMAGREAEVSPSTRFGDVCADSVAQYQCALALLASAPPTRGGPSVGQLVLVLRDGTLAAVADFLANLSTSSSCETSVKPPSSALLETAAGQEVATAATQACGIGAETATPADPLPCKRRRTASPPPPPVVGCVLNPTGLVAQLDGRTSLASNEALSSLPTDGEVSLEVNWMADLQQCIDCSPLCVVLPDGKVNVLCGSHAHLLVCVDDAAGRVVWAVALDGRVESTPCATATGEVVVGTHAGSCYVLRLADGAVLHRVLLPGAVRASPVVDPHTGLIWLGSHADPSDPAAPTLHGVDVRAGAVVRRVGSLGSVVARGVVAVEEQALLFASTRGVVVCVNSDGGDVRWRQDLHSPVFAAPVAYSGTAICCTVQGHMVGMCIASGAALWEADRGAPVFCTPTLWRPAPGPPLLAVPAHDGTVALYGAWAAGDGETTGLAPGRLGSARLDGVPTSCAVLRDGLLLTATAAGRVWLLATPGGAEGTVAGVGLLSARPIFSCAASDPLQALTVPAEGTVYERRGGAAVFSGPVCHGGRVWFGCRNDLLYGGTVRGPAPPQPAAPRLPMKAGPHRPNPPNE